MSPQSLTAVHFIVCGEGTRDNEWIVATSTPLTYANLPSNGTVKILKVPPSPQKNITPVVRIFPKVAEANLALGTDEPMSFAPKLSAPNPLAKGLRSPAPPTNVLGSVAPAMPLPEQSCSVRQPMTSLRVQLAPNESSRTPSALIFSRAVSKREDFVSTIVAQTPSSERPNSAALATAQTRQVEATSGLSSAVPSFNGRSAFNERSALLQEVPSTCPNAPEQRASQIPSSMPVTQGRPPVISSSSAAPTCPRQSMFRGSLVIARPTMCSPTASPSRINTPVSAPVGSSSSFGQWMTSGQPASRMSLPSPAKSRAEQGGVPGANTFEDQEELSLPISKNFKSANNASIPPFRRACSAGKFRSTAKFDQQKSPVCSSVVAELATANSAPRKDCSILSDSALKEPPTAHVTVQSRATGKILKDITKQTSIKSHSEHETQFSRQGNSDFANQDLMGNSSRSISSALHAGAKAKGMSLPRDAPPSFYRWKAAMDAEDEDRISPPMQMISDIHRLRDASGIVASELADDALERGDRPAYEADQDSERGIGVGRPCAKPMPGSGTVHNDIKHERTHKSSCGGLEKCVAQLVWAVCMCRRQKGIAKERITNLKQQLRSVVRRELRSQDKRIDVSSDAARHLSDSDVQQWTTPPTANLTAEAISPDEVAASDVASDFQDRHQLPKHRSEARSAGGRNCPFSGEKGNKSMSQGKNNVSVKSEDVRGIYFIFAQWGLSLSRQERPVHRIAAEAERIANICAGLRSPTVSNVYIPDEDVPRYFKQLDAVAHPILFLVGEMRAGLCKCARVPASTPEVHSAFKQDVKTVLLALRDILEWVRILVDRMFEIYVKHSKQPSSEDAKKFCDDLWSSLFINDNNFIPAMRKTKKLVPNGDELGDGNIYFSRRKRVGDEVVSLTNRMKEVYIWCQAHAEENVRPKWPTPSRASAVVPRPTPEALNQNPGLVPRETVAGDAEEVRVRPGLQLMGEERRRFELSSAGAPPLPQFPDYIESQNYIESPAASAMVKSANANQWPAISKPLPPLLKTKRRRAAQKRVLWNLRHDVGASPLVQSEDMLHFLFADGDNLLGTEDKLQIEAVADRAAQFSKGSVHAFYGWLRTHCVNLQNAMLGKQEEAPEWINLGHTPQG